MDQTTSTNLFDLNIDDQSSSYLSETAKWAKFLAILGFITCGLIAIFAIFAGSVMTMFRNTAGPSAEVGMVSGVFASVIFILVGLLYFFPTLYLYNFASKMQAALRNNDQILLAQSFRNLKSCFKFIGIVTIITLSIYVLVFVVSIIFSAAR